MEAELSAHVRLYPKACVGAGCMAGSSAKRYYCCWHPDLACWEISSPAPSATLLLSSRPKPAHFLCSALLYFYIVLLLFLTFFFKCGIVNLPVVITSIIISSCSTGRASSIVIQEYLKWHFLLVSSQRRRRRNLVLLVSESESGTWGFPLSRLGCCRINFRLITIALSPLSNCR